MKRNRLDTGFHYKSSSPTWIALERAWNERYPTADFWQFGEFGSPVEFLLGNQAPQLELVRAYALTNPEPHWHLLTYGLSESNEHGEQRDVFEFSMRVARDEESTEPFAWTYDLLLALSSIHAHPCGNHLFSPRGWDGRGPCGVLLAPDPEMDVIETPVARIQFMQTVPVAEEDLEAAERTNVASALEFLRHQDPKLIAKAPLVPRLTGPVARDALRRIADAEGSQYGTHYSNALGIRAGKKGVEIEMGAIDARAIDPWMRGRLARGHSVHIHGENVSLSIIASDRPSWRWVGKGILELGLDLASIEEIAQRVSTRPGTVRLERAPGVQFTIRRTEIRDSRGLLVSVYG